MFSSYLILLLIAFCTFVNAESSPVSLPGYKGPELHIRAGYITVDEKTQRNLFYVFIPGYGDPSKLPLSLWLQGGPGCSGLAGLFEENGPFRLQRDGTIDFFDVSYLPYASMIWLEQPAGVGFSYCNEADSHTNDTRAANDIHRFMQGFYQEFPQYKSNKFYLSGESYAGVYIPTSAARILKDPEMAPRLAGFMAGNPVIGCSNEQSGASYADRFVHSWFHHGMVGFELFDEWTKKCLDTNKEHCQKIFNRILKGVGVINQQLKRDNVVQQADTYPSLDPDCLYQDFSTGNGTLASFVHGPPSTNPVSYGQLINTYLNRADVQKALHVRNMPVKWSVCTGPPKLHYNHNLGSMMPFYEDFFEHHKRLRILVYSGDVDIATVPFEGTVRCLNALKKRGPRVQDYGPWFFNGHTAGYFEIFDRYVFATLKGAGHEAPNYQPLTGAALFSRFLKGDNITFGDDDAETVRKSGVQWQRGVTQGDMLRKYGIIPSFGDY